MTTSPIESAPQTTMHGIAWMIAATFVYAFTFVTIREPSRDFSVFYLQLPVVAALAFFFYGEAPDIWVWIGGVVICAASYDIARHETQGEAADQGRRRQQ